MITIFNNFLNEFYTGKYSSAGYKFSEPSDEFDLNINIKADPNNNNILKDILTKYNVTYDKLDIEKIDEEGEKINILFKSYNRYEA